jgi:glycerate kinase
LEQIKLIRAEINHGFKKILLTIEGSATVDALETFCTQIFDSFGNKFSPSGNASLVKISRINTYNFPSIEIIIAFNIENKFLGKNGSVYVFEPQKISSHVQNKEKLLKVIERNMKKFSNLLNKMCGKNISENSDSEAVGEK